MLSITASLGSLCPTARAEKGNETGEKCLWHLWLLLTGSKQDDGHKPRVNILLPVEKQRCTGTGCHLTAPRQFVLCVLAVPALTPGVTQSLEYPPLRSCDSHANPQRSSIKSGACEDIASKINIQ